MKTPSPPKPDDSNYVAQAQNQQNLQTGISNAYMQNANENSPYGSVRYDVTDNYTTTENVYDRNGNITGTRQVQVPRFTRNVTLSPAQQRMLDQQNALGIQMNDVAGRQLTRLDETLSSPINRDNLPAAQRHDLQAPNLRSNIDGGAIDNSAGYDVNQLNLQNRITPAGNVQRGFGSAGNVRRGVANAGRIEQKIQNAGQIQRQVGANDFSQDRLRVEDSINSRLEPQMQRDRAALETQLANQGIMPGSEAYREAIALNDRQRNDMRQQTVLAGGQEQSRMFGLDLAQGQFANQAQQQQYGQNANDAAFFNQGQAQRYGQNLSDAQFANQAQQQVFNQLQDRASFANDAQQQVFGQNAAQMQANNAALQGEFNAGLQRSQNDMARSQFANQAQQQGFDQNTARAQLYNQSQLQGLDAQRSVNEYMGTARERALQEQMSLRNQPINEISALMNGGQVTAPQFSQFRGGNIANTDVAGINAQNYNQRMQAYQAQMANRNAMLGGIGSIAGQLPMMFGGL